MTDKITYGILGLITTMILGFGGYMVLTPDQLDHAYVCTINEKVGFFDSLSATGKTGYWVLDGINKSSVCINGIWKPLKTYAKEKGVDVNIFLNPSNMITPDDSNKQNSNMLQVKCDVNGCIPIEAKNV